MHHDNWLHERTGIGQRLECWAVKLGDWHDQNVAQLLRTKWSEGTGVPLHGRIMSGDAAEEQHESRDEHYYNPGATIELGDCDNRRHNTRSNCPDQVDHQRSAPSHTCSLAQAIPVDDHATLRERKCGEDAEC